MPAICIPCQIEYAVKRNGVMLISMGTVCSLEAYMCDVLECPGCGHQIVTHIASPMAFGDKAILQLIERSEGRVLRYWRNNRERNEFLAAFGQEHPALNQDLVQ